jgi:hypothetical protein
MSVRSFTESKVSTRLRVAVTAVLILLTGVLCNELFMEWRVCEEMAALRRTAIDSTKIIRLINELQAERGLSAAYLGAQGAASRRLVDKQRNLTDNRLPPALTALREFQRFPIGSGGKSLVAQALRELDSLAKIRDQINSRSISPEREFSYYTELIAKLLDVTNDFALRTSRSNVGTIMSAYALLQRAKERAAQERGRTAGVLAAGKISPKEYREISSLVSGQQALLDSLKLTAPASIVSQYETLKTTAVWLDVKRMREELLASALGGGAFKISVQQWWTAATARIQLIGGLEDKVGGELIKIAASIYNRSADSLTQTGLLTLLSLSLSGWALRRAAMGPGAAEGGGKHKVERAEGRARFENARTYRSLGERADNLEHMIADRQTELTLRSRSLPDERRAELQHELGLAYFGRIRGDRADNIEKAIASLESALTVRNRESSPGLWAETSVALAQAHLNRIQGVRSQNIERAINVLEAVCSGLAPGTFADQWAEAKKILGQAYQERIFGDRADNLERAIAALEAVLTIKTPETCPRQWAEIQHSLAAAYANRIRGERADNLERAVIAYGAAHSLCPLAGTNAHVEHVVKR